MEVEYDEGFDSSSLKNNPASLQRDYPTFMESVYWFSLFSSKNSQLYHLELLANVRKTGIPANIPTKTGFMSDFAEKERKKVEKEEDSEPD